MKKYIHRFIENDMLEWKKNWNDKVLYVSGCRQVGKTTTILHFAHEYYKQVIYVNVAVDEYVSKLSTVSEYTVQNVIRELCVRNGIEYIDSNQTVLILDEIQESKAVYERIRVFRNILNCDVIVTGSYLGSLKNAFQPLGDIYKLQLYPLSYQEYLYYYDGYSYYCDHSIEEICNNSDAFEWFKNVYKTYILVGGYPEVFSTYLRGENIESVFENLVEVFNKEFKNNTTDPSDYDKISQMFQAVCKIMSNEKKGSVGFMNDVSALTTQYNKKRLNKEECSNLLAWMSESHIINYVDKMDLNLNQMFPGERAYFEDIGLANYLCSKYCTTTEAKMGLLSETFVYKQLSENKFHDRFYFDRPSFAVYNQYELDFYVRSKFDNLRYGIEVKSGRNIGLSANKLLEKEKVDIIVNAKGESGFGSVDRKYTIPIFFIGKFDFSVGEKVKPQTPNPIMNFMDLDIK